MAYTVKEIFLTLQGEGRNAGRAAVFCRFAGCNLWSGREEDRGSATCQFCDTDFVGGTRYECAVELAEAIAALWPADAAEKFVVLTGGEPLLQVDDDLVTALHRLGFTIAVETNGTIAAPDGIDWLCVSPKAGTRIEQRRADEVKLVYPQPGLPPQDAEALIAADHYLLQPMDGAERERNTGAAVAYCLAHPRWRLSVQTHKWIGIR